MATNSEGIERLPGFAALATKLKDSRAHAAKSHRRRAYPNDLKQGVADLLRAFKKGHPDGPMRDFQKALKLSEAIYQWPEVRKVIGLGAYKKGSGTRGPQPRRKRGQKMRPVTVGGMKLRGHKTRAVVGRYSMNGSAPMSVITPEGY